MPHFPASGAVLGTGVRSWEKDLEETPNLFTTKGFVALTPSGSIIASGQRRKIEKEREKERKREREKKRKRERERKKGREMESEIEREEEREGARGTGRERASEGRVCVLVGQG